MLQPVASASLSWMLRLVRSLKASERKVADCLMGATLEATEGTQSNLSHKVVPSLRDTLLFCSSDKPRCG